MTRWSRYAFNSTRSLCFTACFLCVSALAALGGCSDDSANLECGDGTVERGGACVAESRTDTGQEIDARDSTDVADAAEDADTRTEVGRDAGDANQDVDTGHGEAPLVTALEWGLMSDHDSEGQGDDRVRSIPLGAPLVANVDMTTLDGSASFAQADRVDLQFETEGSATVETSQPPGGRALLAATSTGTMRVRAYVDQEQLGERVYTEWLEVEVVPSEDYEWTLRPLVLQVDALAPLTALEMPRPGSSGALDAPNPVQRKELSVDTPARVVTYLTWQPKSGGPASRIALSGDWMDASVTGDAASVADDGTLTASGPGTIDISASYTPPHSIDAPTHDAEQAHLTYVESAPLRVLAVYWEVDPLSELSRSKLPLDQLDLDLSERDAANDDQLHSTWLMDPDDSALQLYVVGHYASDPVDRVTSLTEYHQDRDRYEHLTYRRVFAADDVTISDHSGDSDALHVEEGTLEIRPGTQPGIRVMTVSADGLTTPLVAGTNVDSSGSTNYELQFSPDTLNFTDWSQCETVDIQVAVDGTPQSIESPDHLGVSCQPPLDSQTTTPHPVETCRYLPDEQKWELCTRQWSYADDMQGYEGNDSAEMSFLKVGADLPLDLDLPAVE